MMLTKSLATFGLFLSLLSGAWASNLCTEGDRASLSSRHSTWPPTCPIDLFPDKGSSYGLSWLGSYEDMPGAAPDHLMSATIFDNNRLIIATALRVAVVGRTPVDHKLPQFAEYRTDPQLPSNLDGATGPLYFHKFYNTAVNGRYVYAATRYDPLYAFQVSGTGRGSIITRKWIAPRSRIFSENVQVKNGNLFVTHHADGVEVMSLADPANPSSLAKLPLTDSWGLAVESDGNILVADGPAGVQWVQFDQTSNTLTRVAGETVQTSPGTVFDVTFVGTNTALAAAGGSGVGVYYFNPGDPDPNHRLVRTGTFFLPGTCMDIEPMGTDMAVLACKTWIHVVRVDANGVLTTVASAKRQARVGPRGEANSPSVNIASHVSVSGDQIYVASWDHLDLYKLVANSPVPDIRLSSQRVAFGSTPAIMTVSVANGGRSNLVVGKLDQSISPHVVCSLNSGTIAPGDTATLAVAYDGKAPVEDIRGCVLHSNDPDDGDSAGSAVAIPIFADQPTFVDPGESPPEFSGNTLLRDYTTQTVAEAHFDLADYLDPIQTGDQVVHFAIWGSW